MSIGWNSNLARRLRHEIESFSILLVVLAFIVLALLVFLVLPPLIVTTHDVPDAAEHLKLQNDVRTTGIQVLGGAILALGALFTARSIRVNREGQITERFTRAIDQLGSEKLDVRLGGIYGLERIARDSRRDHEPIMEVLATYIREHAPWREPTVGEELDGFEAEPTAAELDADESARARRQIERELKRPKPSADVQAALTVIGRRKTAHELEPITIDLSETDLRAVDLSRAQLENVILNRACLQGAVFSRANLRHAEIRDSALNDAEFIGADMRNALLIKSDFRFADLYRADLQGAALESIDFRGAFGLEGAKLTNTRLFSGRHPPNMPSQWPTGFDPEAAGAYLFEPIHTRPPEYSGRPPDQPSVD
jgi:Pentapeptide repeats (8 copies)